MWSPGSSPGIKDRPALVPREACCSPAVGREKPIQHIHHEPVVKVLRSKTRRVACPKLTTDAAALPHSAQNFLQIHTQPAASGLRTAPRVRILKQLRGRLLLTAAIAAGTGAVLVSAEQTGPARASASVLSEHEIDALDSMTPQNQAELLLERSINHYRGANTQISARVDGWRGKIALSPRLNGLFTTAINSDDLTVRAAGLEVDIAARDLEKTSSTVDRLEPDAREGAQGLRANALWDLGLLGNRGVEPERIARILLSSLRDENENVRYWAVEGLAYLGTDETIAPLLETFRYDPSPTIRERAACEPCAIRHAERKAAPHRGAEAARFRRRGGAGSTDAVLGVSGAARHHRPIAAPGRRRVAAVVRERRRKIERLPRNRAYTPRHNGLPCRAAGARSRPLARGHRAEGARSRPLARRSG